MKCVISENMSEVQYFCLASVSGESSSRLTLLTNLVCILPSACICLYTAILPFIITSEPWRHPLISVCESIQMKTLPWFMGKRSESCFQTGLLVYRPSEPEGQPLSWVTSRGKPYATPPRYLCAQPKASKSLY